MMTRFDNAVRDDMCCLCSTIWNFCTSGALAARRHREPVDRCLGAQGQAQDRHHPRATAELRAYVSGVLALGEAGDVLWLQALTGIRISEATGARASEIDPETVVGRCRLSG